MLEVGDILAGKYRIDRVLGQGAMGRVVAATHLELREPRAIKLMLPQALGSQDMLERFVREARAAASLRSQHTVKIYDIDTHSSGALYIVMEHLEGTDFHKLIKDRGALPVGEAAMYVLQACEAIAEAHTKGIVHRDLKPANIFLAKGVGDAPCVKVLDFGIAKVVEPAVSGPTDPQLTSTYMIMGTPLFMSPEQIASTRDVDVRADIWSLGVILYCFVTGRFPFNGSSAQLIFDEVRRTKPKPPSEWDPNISSDFSNVILCCLEKDPAQRYQTVTALATALLPFAPHSPGLSFPSPPLRPAWNDAEKTTQVWTGPATETLRKRRASPVAEHEIAAGLASTDPIAAPVASAIAPMRLGPASRRVTGVLLAGGAALGILLTIVLALVFFRLHGEGGGTVPSGAAAALEDASPPPTSLLSGAPSNGVPMPSPTSTVAADRSAPAPDAGGSRVGTGGSQTSGSSTGAPRAAAVPAAALSSTTHSEQTPAPSTSSVPAPPNNRWKERDP